MGGGKHFIIIRFEVKCEVQHDMNAKDCLRAVFLSWWNVFGAAGVRS